MAAYFDFKEKIPHVNKDDIYVVSGSVIDDQLILDYSLSNYTPLSISLTGFDTFTYINDAEFKDNNLILKYGRDNLADLSINLSTLDKHVNDLIVAEDRSALSLCFNDGTILSAVMSVDTTKFLENFYLSTWYVDDKKNLVLNYNTIKLPSMAIDLKDIANKIVSMNTENNILTISDLMENVASVSLEKFSYNDFITKAELDDANQLKLNYASDYASGHAKDLTVDLSELAKNYYINKSELKDEQLVLSYNNAAAGDSLSTSLSALNTYIESATIDGKTLILSYNSNRLKPIRVNIEEFIKDYYIKDVKLVDDKLQFTYNIQDPELKIDPIDLSKYTKDTNTYIEKITHDEDKDIITFQYNTTELDTHVVNLRKYVNNDIVNIQLDKDTNDLILYFERLDKYITVSLDKFDKYIISSAVDQNNLSLCYNNNKGCIVLDKTEISKAIISANTNGNMFYLHYSDKTPSLSVDMTNSLSHIIAGELKDTNLEFKYSNSTPTLTVDVAKLSTYIEKVELNGNDELIFDYNANNLYHDPLTVNLNPLNNALTSHDINGSNLQLSFKNGANYTIDLSKFDKHIDGMRIEDNNILKLTYNCCGTLETSLSKYDKYIKQINVNNTSKNIEFKYNNTDNPLLLNKDDINYELTGGVVTDTNHIVLGFSNNKANVDIDASSLKSDDTFISTIVHDETNDIIVFDYNNSKVQAKSICLKKYVNNDLVRVALDKDTNNLILYFERLDKYLDVSLDKFDKYVSSLSVDDKSNRLMLFYNNDKGHISIDKDKLDTYTKEVFVNPNNVLVLKDNKDTELTASLDKFDKYTESVKVNNNILVITDNKDAELTASLDKFDKYIASLCVDNSTNKLMLYYNNGKDYISIDKDKLDTYTKKVFVNQNNELVLQDNHDNKLKVSLDKFDKYTALVEVNDDNTLVLTDNKDTELTASLDKFDKYTALVEVNDDNTLVLTDNKNTELTASLDKFDKYIDAINADENNLSLIYNNGKDYISIDKKLIDTYIKEVFVNQNNELVLQDNHDNKLKVSLDKFDKYISTANIDKTEKQIQFKYNNDDSAFNISIPDINYELTSGEVNDNKITLKFSNDKEDVTIDASKLKTVDNYISSGYFDEDESKLVLKYNDNGQQLNPISIDMPEADNYHINNGYFDVDATHKDKKLVLEYNTTTIDPLSIDFNILSNMNFHATNENDVLNMAQAIEQIVTAFGGNRA